MKQSDGIVLEKQLHHLPLVHKTPLKLVYPEKSTGGRVPCENIQMDGKRGFCTLQKSWTREVLS